METVKNLFRLLAVIAVLGVIVAMTVDKSKHPSPVAAPAPDPRDQQIKELSEKVAALEQQKPQHHYELRNDGLRTFRFDPDTGETCIQLTTKDDWKKRETTHQSCAYVDYIASHRGDAHVFLQAECDVVLDDKACDRLNALESDQHFKWSDQPK